jgi:hypothetical protein
MKKINFFIIVLVFFIGLLSTSSSIKKESVSVIVNEQDIREIAFNQLSSKDKDRVLRSWENSKVSKITLKENMGNINDNSYIGKEVYLIDIPTQSISIPNNMIVYVSMDNHKLLGYGYVE